MGPSQLPCGSQLSRGYDGWRWLQVLLLVRPEVLQVPPVLRERLVLLVRQELREGLAEQVLLDRSDLPELREARALRVLPALPELREGLEEQVLPALPELPAARELQVLPDQAELPGQALPAQPVQRSR